MFHGYGDSENEKNTGIRIRYSLILMFTVTISNVVLELDSSDFNFSSDYVIGAKSSDFSKTQENNLK